MNELNQYTAINGEATYSIWGLDLSGTLQGAGGVGGLLARYSASGWQAYAYDANGNVTDGVDSQGDIVAHYEYDAFGNPIAPSGDPADTNPYRFSTKYLDETGLYYYGYRFYSPAMGRWLNRDPIEEEGGENVYAFTGNSPLNHTDLLGERIIRIGFRGAGGPEGNWLNGAEIVFNSLQTEEAFHYILDALDTTADNQVNKCDAYSEIRITGYSWGAWSALTVAKKIQTTSRIDRDDQEHRKVWLGLLDPVRTGRVGIANLPQNVVYAKNIYQRNGCYEIRGERFCPGPSWMYRGTKITGADNVDVTKKRLSGSDLDGVPIKYSPDHIHLQENRGGYATQIGLVLQ